MEFVRGIVAVIACVSVGTAEAGSTENAPPETSAPGVFPDETIAVAGVERHYRLVVPGSADLSQPVPVVIAFHGMLIDNKDVMPRYTKLDELADEKGFILAFPQALGGSWGILPDKVAADLAFFDALLAHIQDRYNVDSRRVFVLGMSNGGYFAHLVGRERSRTIAAVCSHSGPLGLETLLGIRAGRKFPVMIVHGDKDRIFPVAIARENRDKYEREGHVVEYVEVPGLRHFWGTSVDINEQIWEFFEANPLEE